MDLRINKNKWQKYKFEDFVDNIREQAMPSPEDSEKYIGLKHLDSGSLHIKRWGTPIQLKGTKFRMRKGDLLFARRNAYLKRVAIAPHDGLFSAHGMVFRPKESVISSDFLPFFLSSDTFWDRAIQISVGSLSPTINWGTLRHEEFKLPPLPEQKRLADLLWSVDGVTEKYKYSLNELKTLKASKTKQLFCNVSDELIELGNLCIEKPSYGATASAVEFKEGMPRYIRITDISEEGNLINADIKGIGTKDFEKYRLKEGDLLIARTAAVGRAFVYKEEYGDCVYAGYLIKFKLNEEKVLPEYVFSYLQSPIFQDWIRKTTRTGLQANINAKEYSDHKVPTPSLKVQEGIINQIDELKTMECGLLKQIGMLENIKKGLINQIFG